MVGLRSPHISNLYIQPYAFAPPPPPSSGCLLPGSPLHTPFLPSYPPMQPKGFLCQKKSGVPLPGPLPRIKTKLLTAQKAQRLASAHLSILISHDSCLSQTPV